ncbi:hypothetical protein BU23DRAFT_652036 [Bimuria novae-zelandiae CBS 107.79]|uniref:F-box domain-containing protein n=1 Tax=Bimuria novae-zelandiae CBS 107.79 TaxID=1447943 RepID=A0A6A5UYQ7_9PLEO|nr:hypothetical protein BU23DRAFT_652036 [Bimuria novae-zelandiae CBS 107.79]
MRTAPPDTGLISNPLDGVNLLYSLLPTELRLHICSYLPSLRDKGDLYLSCKTARKELDAECAKAFNIAVDQMKANWPDPGIWPLTIIGRSPDSVAAIRTLLINIPVYDIKDYRTIKDVKSDALAHALLPLLRLEIQNLELRFRYHTWFGNQREVLYETNRARMYFYTSECLVDNLCFQFQCRRSDAFDGLRLQCRRHCDDHKIHHYCPAHAGFMVSHGFWQTDVASHHNLDSSVGIY